MPEEPPAIATVEAPPKPVLYRHKYGVISSTRFTDKELELYCFRTNRTPAKGGLGKYEHFRNACALLWPKLVWHPWLEKQIESLCENQWVCWAGCAASGKTFASALYALVWWMSDPLHSTVVLTSTTAKMVRKRVWKCIRQLYYSCSTKGLGNMVDSKTTLQAIKGDDANAIFAQAVAEGEKEKAVANIQGIHNKRIFVVIDEATDTPEAAFDACVNLHSGCTDFQCLVIGNPSSRFDPMGRFAEPLEGWTSVTVDNDEWQTVVQLNGKPGIVCRFDGEKSPNIAEGKILYPFLKKPAEIEGERRRYGETSALYWKFTRGFWAPEGLIKTVVSESLLLKVNAKGTHVFTGNKVFMGAGVDPAFGGGDRAIYRPFKCGELEGGKMGIQLLPSVRLSINAASTNPVHFQLAEQIRMHSEQLGTPPENVGVDASGEGGGLCDIIARVWSPQILRIESGGACSETSISAVDVRRWCDVYDRKVTELWFTVYWYLIAGQIKGLDTEAAFELCNRLFDDSKAKVKLETKKEMKVRIGRSPDEADAVIFACQVAKARGVQIADAEQIQKVSNSHWRRTAKRFSDLYAEEAA